MNNYHYIVASLPDLSTGKNIGDRSVSTIIDEIKARSSSHDNDLISFLEQGFEADKLNKDFYKTALSQRIAFLKEWFRFDLNLRNAKVRYLNSALGRAADRDVVPLDGGEFKEAVEIDKILRQNDILGREHAIDDISWRKVDELTVFHYFDITVILGIIVKLKIIDRWMKLDEKTGREMFRNLVDEVRGTFRGFQTSGQTSALKTGNQATQN